MKNFNNMIENPLSNEELENTIFVTINSKFNDPVSIDAGAADITSSDYDF